MKVKILGAELEADLLNAKVCRKYEEGFGRAVEQITAAKDCEKGSDGIEMQCRAVIEYLDAVFGPGSAKKVLGRETDLLSCLDALEELGTLYEAQVNPIIREKTESIRASLSNGEA